MSTCDTGVFLDKGKLLYWGAAERAVDLYLSHVRRLMNEEALGGRGMAVSTIPVQTQIPGTIRYGTGQVQLESVSVTDADGRECRAFRFGDDILINATFRSYGEFESLSVSFLVRDATGIDLFGTTTFDENVTLPPIHRGQRAEVRFRFTNALRSGNFAVSLAVHQLSRWDYSDNLLFDQVDGCATFATTPDPNRPVHYKLHVPTEVDVRLGG